MKNKSKEKEKKRKEKIKREVCMLDLSQLLAPRGAGGSKKGGRRKRRRTSAFSGHLFQLQHLSNPFLFLLAPNIAQPALSVYGPAHFFSFLQASALSKVLSPNTLLPEAMPANICLGVGWSIIEGHTCRNKKTQNTIPFLNLPLHCLQQWGKKKGFMTFRGKKRLLICKHYKTRKANALAILKNPLIDISRSGLGLSVPPDLNYRRARRRVWRDHVNMNQSQSGTRTWWNARCQFSQGLRPKGYFWCVGWVTAVVSVTQVCHNSKKMESFQKQVVTGAHTPCPCCV